MGAITKVNSWRPEEKLSPSFTVSIRELRSIPRKNWESMVFILSLQMMRVSGWRSMRDSTVAAWSGSM